MHGVAFGGGFQICLGADMRFVAPDAQLSVMEIKWGLVPDMAGVVLMRRLVRDDVTRELIFSGRIFNGQEALGHGLTTRVCEVHAAKPLNSRKRWPARAPMRSARPTGSSPWPPRTISARYRWPRPTEQTKLIGSPNQVEVVRANLEKRAPQFAD